MAAVIGRFAAAGAKSGGKFATKAVTKKGGKGLAKSVGKVGKKKGLKKLAGGKGGKLKKFAEGQLKGAVMSGIDNDCGDEGPESGEKHSKKPIKIKSPDRSHKSTEKESGALPKVSKSKIHAKAKNHAKSKVRGRHDTDGEDDDDSGCGGESGGSDKERSTSREKGKKRGRSSDSNSKSKKKIRDDKKDKKNHKHHSTKDESDRKSKNSKERNKRQRSRDKSTDSESEKTRKTEKRKDRKSGKKNAKRSTEDACPDTSDSEMEKSVKKQHKKGKIEREEDLEDSSDGCDTEYENVTKRDKKGNKKALPKKKKEKHNISNADDGADNAKEWSRRKWKHKSDKKSGMTESEVTSSCDEKHRFVRNRRSPTHAYSTDTSSDEELCISLRDIRFGKRNGADRDRRGVDEFDCCSRYTPSPAHMSMRELCQVIKEVSNSSGEVDVKRLAKSLSKRARLATESVPLTVIDRKRREPFGGRRNAAGDVKQNHTNSNEEECKSKTEKQLRTFQNMFGGRKKQKNNISNTPMVTTEENLTPRIESPIQTQLKPANTYEDLLDRDFNMMLFKVAKELIMDEYQKKKNCEPDENDEWLRAFEMVVKFDNAKDIRAAQLKHEEMKLESKYLKKGQAKHFKRGKYVGGERVDDGVYQDEVTMPDDGLVNLEGECRRRSKLDHLYDLIYALRGAPRRGDWKRSRLALPSNVEQSAATQLVPVYLPWELPQNDLYGAYYTDSYGYENQGYYQQC